MESRWTGTAYFTGRFLAYVGPLGATALHAHHAIQIAKGLNSLVAFRDGHGRMMSGESAVIPRDTPHGIAKLSEQALLIFINPEDTVGRRFAALALGGRVRAWFSAGKPITRLRLASLSLDTPGDWERVVLDVTRQLVGEIPPASHVHPAIRRLLSQLPSLLDGDVRLPILAQNVGLSAGRLGHLFSKTVGIPLRPYILWLRLQRAAAEVRGGASLTTAAHAAGFTDSSHLSNTFRRMFGLSPSDVTEHLKWVVPEPTSLE